MNANANIVKMEKGTSKLVRPRFSPGLLLRDDDLRTGVDYTRELSRLLFRSLFGCGVVCGLEVEAGLKCGKLVVTINPGVALSRCGDPIHVQDPVKISVDPTCGEKIPDTLWAILCRTERCCAPRSAVCGCEEEDSASVCTREQEGFEIRLVKGVEGDCICKCNGESGSFGDRAQVDIGDCWCADPCSECYKKHYAGLCECECCEPDCVVLAVLTQSVGTTGLDESGQGNTEDRNWTADHGVRRFVRPVLMRDPVAFRERYPEVDPCKRFSPQQEQAAGELAAKRVNVAASKMEADRKAAIATKVAESKTVAAKRKVPKVPPKPEVKPVGTRPKG
jgi:hypothetical protein